MQAHRADVTTLASKILDAVRRIQTDYDSESNSTQVEVVAGLHATSQLNALVLVFRVSTSALAVAAE